jgi:hypothetical protein
MNFIYFRLINQTLIIIEDKKTPLQVLHELDRCHI